MDKLLTFAAILNFLLIFFLFVLALWFVLKLQLKAFPKTVLIIIVVICLLILIDYLFMVTYLNNQLNQFRNMFGTFSYPYTY